MPPAWCGSTLRSRLCRGQSSGARTTCGEPERRVLIRVAAPRDLSRDRHVGHPEQRSDKPALSHHHAAHDRGSGRGLCSRCPRGRHCRSGRHRTNAVGRQFNTTEHSARHGGAPHCNDDTPAPIDSRADSHPLERRNRNTNPRSRRGSVNTTAANACGGEGHHTHSSANACGYEGRHARSHAHACRGGDGCAHTYTHACGGDDGRARSYVNVRSGSDGPAHSDAHGRSGNDSRAHSYANGRSDGDGRTHSYANGCSGGDGRADSYADGRGS